MYHSRRQLLDWNQSLCWNFENSLLDIYLLRSELIQIPNLDNESTDIDKNKIQNPSLLQKIKFDCNHKIKSDFVNSTSKTANKFFLFSRIRCISFCNILVTSFSKTKGTLVSKYTNTKSYPKFECCRKLLNELH